MGLLRIMRWQSTRKVTAFLGAITTPMAYVRPASNTTNPRPSLIFVTGGDNRGGNNITLARNAVL